VSTAVVDTLVWLDRHQASRALRRLGRFGRVVQVLPPRLASVAVPDDVLDQVFATNGVHAVFTPGDPAVVPYPSPAEALFIAAWTERSEPKARSGSDRDGEAPGSQPQERPSGEDQVAPHQRRSAR
jgi:hypothetical protein